MGQLLSAKLEAQHLLSTINILPVIDESCNGISVHHRCKRGDMYACSVVETSGAWVPPRST